MSKTSAPIPPAEPINGFYSGGSRHPNDLARALPAARIAPQKTARSRVSAVKSKKARSAPLGPTPERIAKGDLAPPRSYDGFHRSISTVERLRDQGKLDHNPRTNEAMFQAAQRLRRHYDGCQIGVKAQDLNRITGRGDSADLTQEEAWVEHHKQFTLARKLMGWTEAHPNRGPACIVIAVVCDEMTVSDAAMASLVPARAEAMKAAAMDRLREGLFCLAVHWRQI